MSQTHPLPKELYRAAEVRAMDRYAINVLGIPGIDLMRRAGLAAFAVLRERWPKARTLSVLCGGGNNGGDGYVVARLALEAGWDVRVYPVAPPASLTGDALTAYEDYRSACGDVLNFIPDGFEGAEVLVDGLLGTGLDREVEGRYAEVIRAANRFQGGVLALDIPSGLSADSGAVLGVALKADVTVTFIGAKRGLFTGEGLEYTGNVVFADLDTAPETKHAVQPSALLLPTLERGLPRRSRTAHKGHFGHVLVVGGERGYGGAARLAAEASARVGAGLVSVATREDHAALLNLTRPEFMSHGVADAGNLPALFERANVVAIGPGLGCSDWAKSLFAAAVASELPLVVDADGLNLLAEQPTHCERWILTPHPGEAARLLGVSTAEVQRDRFAAALELHTRYGGVIVLKGAGTLIAGADGPPRVCGAGNPGMASGGMGDVLSGIIGALLGQKLSPYDAACAGCVAHGAAADVLAARFGTRGMLATDLFSTLQRIVNPEVTDKNHDESSNSAP